MIVTVPGDLALSVAPVANIRNFDAGVEHRIKTRGGQASPIGPVVVETEAASVPAEVRVPEVSGIWSKLDESRFLSLAKRFSDGTLNASDRREYDRLKQKRRTTHHPRTGTEVLIEYRRRLVEDQLSRALDAYVSFIETAGR